MDCPNLMEFFSNRLTLMWVNSYHQNHICFDENWLSKHNSKRLRAAILNDFKERYRRLLWPNQGGFPNVFTILRCEMPNQTSRLPNVQISRNMIYVDSRALIIFKLFTSLYNSFHFDTCWAKFELTANQKWEDRKQIKKTNICQIIKWFLLVNNNLDITIAIYHSYSTTVIVHTFMALNASDAVSSWSVGRHFYVIFFGWMRWHSSSTLYNTKIVSIYLSPVHTHIQIHPNETALTTAATNISSKSSNIFFSSS